MVPLTELKMAWALLDRPEKRSAIWTLLMIIIGALSAAVMVGSVMPFLAVLAEPERIHNVQLLNWAYTRFEFQSKYSFLVAVGLSSISLVIISSALQILKTWAVVTFSMNRMHSISARLLEMYLSQPYTFFLNSHSGEMSVKVLAEVEQVVREFLRPAAELIASTLTVVAVVTLLLWVNTVVTVSALVVIGGIYAWISFSVRRFVKRMGVIRVSANRQRFRLVNEALTGVKDIKLLGKEVNYLDRFCIPSEKMVSASVSISLASSLPPLLMQALMLSGVLTLCVVLITPAGYETGFTLDGILPLLGVFAFAGLRLLPELSKIYGHIVEMQARAPAVKAIYNDLFEHKDHQRLSRNEVPPLGLRKKLELNEVSFHYPNAERAGIRNVSLTIRAGEKIGIVGSSGAGKTTLADVILGLLQPDTGSLLCDGVKVSQENLRAWMRTVGYVPQDIFLTDASIAENIALGISAEDIVLSKVRAAARIARIDEFMMHELPDQYESHIGERGIRLSGGQRQRIGIARALYHDADLIVFDEATSALDNHTESEVMQAIDALHGEKTILMIAHRLSTVEHCDRIIVLDHGEVVGFDTWDALKAANPAFQRIAHQGEAA
jgi:ATP-binding cassette, subfamily B, bacterial PglK